MRVAITNHRSRLEDFDVLVKEVLWMGEALESGRLRNRGGVRVVSGEW